jgi:hypothetical protein
MLYEFNCIYVHPYVHSITCILSCTHLHPPSGADEVSGQSWQLVTVSYDEGDGQILCQQHS